MEGGRRGREQGGGKGTRLGEEAAGGGAGGREGGTGSTHHSGGPLAEQSEAAAALLHLRALIARQAKLISRHACCQATARGSLRYILATTESGQDMTAWLLEMKEIRWPEV